MNCEAMRETLPLLAGALLPAEEARAATVHLLRCPACQSAMADFERIHGAFLGPEPEAPDSRFVAGVMRKISAVSEAPAMGGRIGLFDRVLVAGVALLAGGALVYAVDPETAFPNLVVPELSSATSLVAISLLAGFALWQMGGALAALGNGAPRRSSA